MPLPWLDSTCAHCSQDRYIPRNQKRF